uniref:Dual specificity phosphatase 13a n=1 Tax=Cyprinus carpio TaxID=7962 RepID=A0A8C2K4H6_CYPCA
MSLKELCAYETPSVAEMQNFLLADRWPTGHVNQVWPNVYIGNEYHETSQCCIIWITHIVNAASGPPHVNTGPLEADDSSDFILRNILIVFAHCLMGVSRSATLVLAFLMICEDLTLMEAIKAVRQHRDSCPNLGFLNQLRHLDMTTHFGSMALDKGLLTDLGITHVVNCAGSH